MNVALPTSGRPGRWTIRLIAVIFGAATLLGVVAAPAQARAYLGGVDMGLACFWQHKEAGQVYEELMENNVYGWRCGSPFWAATDHRGVSVKAECVRVFGDGAYADFTDFNNPRSWGCYWDGVSNY